MKMSCAAAATVLALACHAQAQAQDCPTGSRIVEDPGTLLVGKTLCAVRGSENWQEFHDGGPAGGPLKDYKRGPNSKSDPSEVVGHWSATTGSDATVTHSYGGRDYSWAICNFSKPGRDPAIVLVGPTETIDEVSLKSGEVPCL